MFKPPSAIKSLLNSTFGSSNGTTRPQQLEPSGDVDSLRDGTGEGKNTNGTRPQGQQVVDESKGMNNANDGAGALEDGMDYTYSGGGSNNGKREVERFAHTSAELFSQALRQRSEEQRALAQAVILPYVTRIDEVYELFEEVMPSGTRGSHVKAVIFARRRSDHKKVIIKLRNKSSSFKDLDEMKEWVLSMKYLYLLSGGAAQQGNAQPGNLIQVSNMVDVIEDPTNYYACMEHVEGRDLFDFFLQEKIYARSYRLGFVQQLCRSLLNGLEEFQSKGMIHKDLKLENVVFDETANRQAGENLVCVPKFIDFDTVEIWVPGRKAFHVLGTDQYIAPETYAGFACPASDMWAIGVICYTMLTGCFPFHQGLFNDRPGENFVDHVAMQQVPRRMRIARIDWSNRAWVQDTRARDFVRRCFVCDATRRLSLEEAQVHAWMRDDPIPQE